MKIIKIERNGLICEVELMECASTESEMLYARTPWGVKVITRNEIIGDITNTPKSDIYKEIIEYLNKVSKKDFKSYSKANIRHINARLNEGFLFDDFKKVIDVKCSQWLLDEKFNAYLRPETLFGTKFESYLNESPQIIETKKTSIPVSPSSKILK